MTRLRHAVLINRPLTETYRLASQVERYPEFLPGYLESRIVGAEDGRLLLQRKARVGKSIKAWKSWASFQTNETIHFEHAEGPLKGMKVLWRFKALGPKQTELVIFHAFEIKKPIGFGWWMEKFFYRLKIAEIAEQVVLSFKTACENAASLRTV